MIKSFLQALRSRYGAEDDIESYDPTDFLVGGKAKVGTTHKMWELVGMEKTRKQQSRYDRLFVVVLREENIGVALTEAEEKKTFLATQHAPLSVRKSNSVDRAGGQVPATASSGMEDAATPQILLTVPHLNALEAENMTRLEELDLSANPLPLREVGKLLPYFTHLRVLQLSDIPHLLPAVTEEVLHKSSSLSPTAGCPPLCQSDSIEKLVLNNVGFTSLSALLLWINLPRLEELHLDHNHLSALPLLPALDATPDEMVDLHDASETSKMLLTMNAPQRHRPLRMLLALHHILLSRRHSMPKPLDEPKEKESEKQCGEEKDVPFSLDTSLFSFPSIRILSLANNQFSRWGGESGRMPSTAPAETEVSSGSLHKEERNQQGGEKERITETAAGSILGTDPAAWGGVHSVYVSPSPGIGVTLRHFFPSLEQLFLSENPLPDIPLPPPFYSSAFTAQKKEHDRHDVTCHAQQKELETYAETYGFLHALKLLCLRHVPTMVSTTTFDAIRQLSPVLDTFRISYSSFLPHWNDTLSRLYVMASLPTLKVLNRGVVREKERLDAEVFYIQCGRRQREKEKEEKHEACTVREMEEKKDSHTGGEPNTATSSSPSPVHSIRYPLLSALEEKHKDLVLSIYREGVIASVDGVTGGASVTTPFMPMTITLYPENLYAASSASNGKKKDYTHAQSVKVPFHMTVGKLKSLVWSLFMVKPENQQLRYQPGGDAGVIDMPTLLDNELETLGYFGVTNEGKIGITDTSLR